MRITLITHFNEEELTCKCGCGAVCSGELLFKLEALRRGLDRAVIVNSGARCPTYNKAIKGAENSFHISTVKSPSEAVDIRLNNGSERFEIVSEGLKLGFTGIGVGEDFIHLDIRKSAPVLFVY